MLLGVALLSEIWNWFPPDLVNEQQTHQQSPGTHRRQEESQQAVALQQEVAGVCLPDEEKQHYHVYNQSPPVGSRPTKVRAERAATAALVHTPAEVACQRHVEEDQL